MKRIFSSDHKVIGVQYALIAMVFLLIGFALMMLMRWQLAYPGRKLPAGYNGAGGDSWIFADEIVVR